MSHVGAGGRAPKLPAFMRLATSLLVLAIAGLASTCRLHDLVSPGRINSLRTTPVELLDSARA
ncbi:MAG: hypothetical protein ACHQDE_09870, partial [Acidimicrobiia bacterium]